MEGPSVIVLDGLDKSLVVPARKHEDEAVSIARDRDGFGNPSNTAHSFLANRIEAFRRMAQTYH
jgi:bifunctional DNase/RNase